jgi:hypothetical protein
MDRLAILETEVLKVKNINKSAFAFSVNACCFVCVSVFVCLCVCDCVGSRHCSKWQCENV